MLCHQASVTGKLKSTVEELVRIGANIVCLFSPQHGFFAEKQANMVESSDTVHPLLKIPVYSLYGPRQSPTDDMLEKIEALIIDLQDVGTRVYTYPVTMGIFLEALSGRDIKVVVLDRPNPLGTAIVEGNIVEEDYKSFVGRYSIPMRHGLTIGEYAKFVVKEKKLDLDLEVVTLLQWRSHFYYSDTGLPWVFPSPNMPTFETAMVYPGMVLLEGTNVSEGRGTTLPFLIFGAPFINPYEMLKHIPAGYFEEKFGVFLRPIFFEPKYDKWKDTICGGFQIHILEGEPIRPYQMGLELIRFLLMIYPEDFKWLNPPYEYETTRLPIDILIGSQRIRKALENQVDIDLLETEWSEELSSYLNLREDVRIYH